LAVQLKANIGWLKQFLLLGVGLMFGLLGGIREVINTFSTHPDPSWQRKLFWACVWIASFLSLIIAWIQENHELVAERAWNKEPKLAGWIDCLEHDAGWDIERFGVDEEDAMHLKVCFTLAVTLSNHSTAATTVSGFTLDILWAGREYRADWLPVSNYSVKRGIPRSDFDEWGYETISSPLTAFPDNVEITNRNHQSGWLRFLARRIPPRSADSATLHKDATLRLCALDRKGQPHTIYEGTWDLPPCGSIEKTLY
jgi:hypothetical protein